MNKLELTDEEFIIWRSALAWSLDELVADASTNIAALSSLCMKIATALRQRADVLEREKELKK